MTDHLDDDFVDVPHTFTKPPKWPEFDSTWTEYERWFRHACALDARGRVLVTTNTRKKTVWWCERCGADASPGTFGRTCTRKWRPQ